jgi:hypothetical protein
MASSDREDSPSHRNEKWSKTNQDRAVASSSQPTRTKAACAHDVGGARGHGRSARASASASATPAPVAPPPRNLVGAVAW